MKSSVRSVNARRNSSAGLHPVTPKDQLDKKELNYLRSFIDLETSSTLFISSDYFSEAHISAESDIHNLINIDWLNNISDLNKFVSNINSKLPQGGLMAAHFLSEERRRTNIRQSYSSNWLFNVADTADYLWHHGIAKTKLTQNFYKRITKNKPRVLPLGEVLGRVAAGGFDIIDYKRFGDLTFFIARKTGVPSYGSSEPHNLIFKMKRIGENGKTVNFYKFRTMHLYASHLQKFLYRRHGLTKGDKINNDFRITRLGNFLRKYWLDEVPMLINWLKGDLKLVGVRPLSNHKFNLYSKNLQYYRTKFKPGLIPPFYADLPDSLQQLMNSEIRYLHAYEKAPLKTDVKYFFKALYNIFLGGARSH